MSAYTAVFIPAAEPVVVLAPLMFSQQQAKDTVEEVLRSMPEGYERDDLIVALGRRGFAWPTVVEVAVP